MAEIKEYKNLINGEWKESKEQITIYSPIDNKEIGKVQAMTHKEIDDAMAAAKAAMKAWREVPIVERAKVLYKAAELLEKRKIAMPVWDAANPAVVQAWKDASLGFAQGARGELKAVIGQTLRPGSVWETTELPALKGNPQVRKITVIDPASRAERVIFER